MLTLSSLQFWVATSVYEHARKAGVQQKVDFPSGLLVSFSPNMPVFAPMK